MSAPVLVRGKRPLRPRPAPSARPRHACAPPALAPALARSRKEAHTRANPYPEVTDPVCRFPLSYILLSTRGSSPWRPDAVCGTVECSCGKVRTVPGLNTGCTEGHSGTGTVFAAEEHARTHTHGITAGTGHTQHTHSQKAQDYTHACGMAVETSMSPRTREPCTQPCKCTAHTPHPPDPHARIAHAPPPPPTACPAQHPWTHTPHTRQARPRPCVY